MTYDSIREMADLVEGVIESVAMNYQTAIQFEKKHIKKKTITYMNIF